ncbi:UDP-N-acetylglucosamine 4,6-dehydratase (inverting) [Fundidesulfovibrio magnetotacticus]|uniref:UDP-N-acetylglucosamine 4,6-dehydratase (Inverting) n=1 Tax=Fundidesulfovibrio magnetotacticus TaxID=2730080 RepID=A0A6V8M341_9BACT|nr:UDP-N-acetylglucosamine 4,6-dehydratase (inverting) [Fundidesulfovibrio magnetotacticus]GFK94865.1 UDP-N-acetylglucosamine 4,6-dehydratase (inverting) [Fundidesulfovibrio magnetotacticus]
MLNDKTILITGGTGSFGHKCTEVILSRFQPRKLIIFSRDEFKQYEMAQKFPTAKYPCMRYFIGDVRDKERLYRAFQGVDYVIHGAALKQVPTAEYNPTEVIKTNIYGAENIINVAADRGVKNVLALSTDKAANPVNLYGATKLCSDKLFVAANAFIANDTTRYSVVRYGNVLGSRGSVIPFFLQQKPTGVLPVTDPRMTRFWITLEQGVDFVLKCLDRMLGGEVFVPKLPSMNIMDLARAICPECETPIVGIRPGEKIHEVMVPLADARNTLEFKNHYIILPDHDDITPRFDESPGERVPEDFEYSSGTNPWLLTVDELRDFLNGQ